jgi:hypothetical protein
MLRQGTRVGPYEVLGALGAGGMGQVYPRLRLLRDLPIGHRAAARRDADSTAALVTSQRSGSRGAKLSAQAVASRPAPRVFKPGLRETWSRRELS